MTAPTTQPRPIKLTRRQTEILSLVRRAGNAASIRVNDERGIAPIRILVRYGLLHYVWTGCVAYLWIGDRNACPFIYVPGGIGYEHAESPVEPARVSQARFALLGLGRRDWARIIRGERVERAFSREPITLASLASEACR